MAAGARSKKRKVLVLTGDDDRVIPPAASKRTADLLGADSRYVELAETGHLPMDERPEEVAGVLLDFIFS